MLNTLDIVCPFDSEYSDGSLRRTKDRSRHGIHPLVGDGTTSTTFPTWDARNGLYTFDGGDYLKIRNADDVKGVLASMGGNQEETFLFYFRPWIELAGTNIHLLFKGNVASSYVRLLKTTSNTFQFRVTESGGGDEIVDTATTVPAAYHGKRMLIAFVRATNRQEIWIGNNLVASDKDTSVDGSSTDDLFIGASSTPAEYLRANTGLRFIGYARKAFTGNKLRAIKTYFEEML